MRRRPDASITTSSGMQPLDGSRLGVLSSTQRGTGQSRRRPSRSSCRGRVEEPRC
jgi:hypothetical protein